MPNKPNTPNALPALPKSWSELTWQQLTDCWQVKIRYGSNTDLARAAAFMELCGLDGVNGANGDYEPSTGERQYLLTSRENSDEQWICTARELAYYAKQAMPWFDYPYGDGGDKEEKDEKGNIIKERREGVRGYVSNMHDAMILPITETEVGGTLFALPQAACSSLTWEQYRALQVLAPQLFADGITEEQALDIQAQFLAHCLIPAQDAAPTSDKFGAKHVFKYDSLRAERTIPFWKNTLSTLRSTHLVAPHLENPHPSTLFHICFQVYQTAIGYYATVYPLLFGGPSKSDPLQDALTGETATIDAIMMKAHYTSQQEVYDTNLPFILDILNTMTKEAKEIEKMNAKMKRKR